jgi:AcrR family transcriptional regulator
MPPPSRTPGQRAGLTRGRVLAAAREVLAEHGVAGLSMRAVAARLGVSPNALYSHVDDKTALIDDVLDDLLAEIRAPDPDADDPVAALHALMTSTHEVLLAHADLVPAYLARQGGRGANAQALGAVMVALLARVGLTGAAAREAQRVLIIYTIGFSAFVVEGPTEELAANFDRGLRWLLDGITTPRS